MSKQKHHHQSTIKEQRVGREDLDSLALGLADLSPLAALDRPGEVRDGNDEEGVAAKTNVSNFSISY
jgi:hypothetical protein